MRIALAALAVAAVAGGVVFATTTGGSTGTTAGPDATASVAPTPAATQSTPQSTPPSVSSTDDGDRAAAASLALRRCRAKVRAADDVLAEARTGIGHWATHVQAQTDANASRITTEQMGALFKKTRLAGPADHRRYGRALTTYQRRDGSCATVKGAGAKTATALKRCNQRAKAQRPVLAAAEDGMADWKSHLADMQRNAEDHVDGAQDIWIDAWRAAPPHIKAYRNAAKRFDAPAC